MKTKLLSKGTFSVVFFFLILSSCNPVELIIPTATITPAPTATFTPTPVPAPIRLGDYPLLSPEDMRYDLDELFHRIGSTHPDPYAKRSKEEVDLERQKIYEELGQGMNIIEFYRKIAPLVASLGDHHTMVGLPYDVVDLITKRELFFPLYLDFKDERGYITLNYSGNPDVPLGTEVLSINGRSLPEIQDGLLGLPFWLDLWLVTGSISEYRVELQTTHETTPIMVDIPGKGLETMMQYAGPSQGFDQVAYTKIQDEPIGVLTVNDFVGIGPLLTPAFAQIQEDGVQYLIVDIRSNGGGKYDEVDALMDFLVDHPYKRCSRSYEAPFGGYGTGAPREVTCELIQPFDAAERFQGKLYLLIGPDTFSAGITLATILQDYGLAIVIGDETADTASYCANVVLGGMPLPRTGLRYTLSETCYVRPSGVLDNLPVIPDLFVETTIEDAVAGRDPVLDYVLEMIRNSE